MNRLLDITSLSPSLSLSLTRGLARSSIPVAPRQLLRLPPEKLLLRWFNHHLAEAGSPIRVSNFGSDLTDSEAYATLLTRCTLTFTLPPLCSPIYLYIPHRLGGLRHVAHQGDGSYKLLPRQSP